jgi:hypothetical protein
MTKRKSTKGHNDLQNIHIKLKDWVTQTPLQTGDELRCSGRVSSSCSTSDTCCVNLVTNEERTGKCLRQVEHIHGHLWHIKVVSRKRQSYASTFLVLCVLPSLFLYTVVFSHFLLSFFAEAGSIFPSFSVFLQLHPKIK